MSVAAEVQELEQRIVLDSDDQVAEAIDVGAASRTFSRTGELTADGDVDLYKFTVTAGQVLRFDIDRPAGSTVDTYLRLFNRRGIEIAANDDGRAPGEGFSTESFIEFRFATAGTYYVGVSHFENTRYSSTRGTGDVAPTDPADPNSSGGYRLNFIPSGPLDSDDTIDEATTLVALQTSGSISPAGDVDVYSFSMNAGQVVFFDTDRVGGNLDTYLRVFDAGGRELVANDDRPGPGEARGTESYLQFRAVDAGTYYVAVSASGNESYSVVSGLGDDTRGTTGDYVLKASFDAPAAAQLNMAGNGNGAATNLAMSVPAADDDDALLALAVADVVKRGTLLGV